MKALLLVMSALASTTACSTTASGGGPSGSEERLEIVALEEMSLEYIETIWGKPEVNIPAGEGRTVRYKNIHTENEDPLTNKVDVKYCDVRLDVDRRMLVRKWQYETCRPKD